MASIDKLSIIIDAQNKASAELNRLKKDIDGIKKTTQKATDTMSSSFSGLKTTLMGLGIGYALQSIGAKVITLAGNLEQAEVAFSTMLGSASEAKKLLGELSDFASKTPFELTGIRQTAKQLLAFGFSADELIPTLKSLGDVASGLSVPIEQVAYAYGQVRTANQLYGTELRQFMNAGIPILAELARMYGVTESAAKEMVEDGKVGFKDVEKAFQNMSGEGGKFFNMMEKQSGTFQGQVSNMKDNLNKLAETIGMALLPIMTDLVKQMIPVIENLGRWIVKNKDVIESIGIFLIDVIKNAIKFLQLMQEGINNLADVIVGFVEYTLAKWYQWRDGIKSTVDSVRGFIKKITPSQKTVDLFSVIPSGAYKARALGGPVVSGQPYIVGERGPEMFVPKSSGNIVPNNKLGGSININLGGVFINNGRDENWLIQTIENTIVRAVKGQSLGYI